MPNSFSPETRLADISAGQFEEMLTRAMLRAVNFQQLQFFGFAGIEKGSAVKIFEEDARKIGGIPEDVMKHLD